MTIEDQDTARREVDRLHAEHGRLLAELDNNRQARRRALAAAHNAGVPVTELAKRLDTSRHTVHRLIRQELLEADQRSEHPLP